MTTSVQDQQPAVRAPPLPVEALHVLVGYSLFSSNSLFGLSLHGLLRTRGLLGIRKSHISQVGPPVICLGMTKGGKRAGASESIRIREKETLRRLWQWLNTPGTPSLLCGTALWNSSHLEEDL